MQLHPLHSKPSRICLNPPFQISLHRSCLQATLGAPPSPIPILDLDLSQSSHLKRSSPVWTSPQHPICLSHLYSHFFHEDFPGQTSLSGCWLPFVCTSCASNDGASGKLKWVWCIFILSAFVHCPAQSACVKLLLWTRHGNKCQV